MTSVFKILFLLCIVNLEVVLSLSVGPREDTRTEKLNESEELKGNDLEGAETSSKLFNLGSLFPTYSTYPSYPSYRPGYPTTGGAYYPTYSSSGFYPSYNPNQGYYPGSNTGFYPSTGTNILGHGSYPSQSYYPRPGYSQPDPNPWLNIRTRSYDRSSGSSSHSGFTGYGGYGGYGGNGGLKSYNGYNNPQYDGKRNLGFGYYADTDRYGFYRSPSQQLSVNRGYD